MTTTATPFRVPKQSQAAFQQLLTSAWNMSYLNWNIREQLRQKDLVYMREQDYTQEQWRARLANMYGDPNKLQNVTVPIVMPQVESAVVYQAGVFLTGNPIFGVVSTPQFADAAQQMEAIMEENSIRGAWPAELLMWIRDGLKYNLSALEVVWERKMVPSLETQISQSIKQAIPKQVNWEGNVLRRWDMYNTFWDTRVAPRDVPEKGEFVGRTEIVSRIALKQFIATLPDKMESNLKAAFESAWGGANTSYDKYYVPFVNPMALLSVTDPRATTDWMAWAGLSPNNDSMRIQYSNMYQLNTLYARIIPADFGLEVPAKNTPQIWKFIFVNGQVLIYAERQTNAHNMLPVFFHQPLEDGLDYQTKSFQDNITPFQQLASTFMNSAVSARRRAISDRALYDPSRIDAKEINNPSASAKIPVRSAAYGKPLGEAVYPFPFRDDQSPMAMQEMQQMMQFANIASGQNQAQQGQFVKGNKTLFEFDNVMQNANGRNQNIAIGYEVRSYSKIKEVLKLNILQYQGNAQIYSVAQDKVVSIDPATLRKAVLTFKISDGLLPSDKIINGDTFNSLMQFGLQVPQIGQGYNVPDMFTYLMKMRGADLKPFQKPNVQVEYEKAQAQWMQLAQVAIEKGQPFNVPQPTPQQFGYNPDARTGESPKTSEQSILEQVTGTSMLGGQNPNSPMQAALLKQSQQPLDSTTPPTPSATI